MDKLTTAFDIVKTFLETKKKSRDNDEYLVCLYWHREMKLFNINLEFTRAKHFFRMYADGKFTSADTITRARRKVNEMYAETRGESYNNRKERLNEEIKKEIQTISVEK